ncbi:probable G-protein coupled receptor 82 [Hyla sarda]|uniref:probable G-protein coupled receptor 82 n=1 Tax=Hyla sarda TaxID=327740 RepID=UPI0024C347A2|nr:probable G-protein coupled receptor 82 [Hyla sarda]
MIKESMGNNTECLMPSAFTSTGLPMVYALMFLPSIFGNIISLVIFKRLSRKTSTHIYLINLAISNMVVSTGMPFQMAYYSQAQYWSYNSGLCSIVYQAASILTHCSMCVSFTIFCWIAVSRYATIMKHKTRMQVKPKTSYEKIIFGQILKTFQNPQFAFYLCTGVWLSLLFPNIAFFLVNQDLAPDKHCFAKEAQIVEQKYKITSVLESTFFFIFFLVVLLFYYFFVKHIQQSQANSCIGKKHLVYSKVKNNIIVIVTLLLLCFTPYHLSKFLLAGFDYSHGCQKLSALIEIKNCCLCLAEFRSCTDPIVYFVLDDTFKKNFLLFCKKCSKDEEVSSSTANNQSNIQTQTLSRNI